VRYEGAAQWFERGFMLWTSEPDRFYVFLFEGSIYTVIGAPYASEKGQEVTATPPPGLLEPTSGFGLVWRGEIATGNVNFDNLPTRLGWATGPEQAYETEFQCQAAVLRTDERCWLRDPNGAVISMTALGSWARWL
jgi:hypothetical protein